MAIEKNQTRKKSHVIESARRFLGRDPSRNISAEEQGEKDQAINLLADPAFAPTLLADLSLSLAKTEDLDALLANALKLLCQRLELEDAQVFRLESTNESVLTLCTNTREIAVKTLNLPVNADSSAGRAVIEKVPVLTAPVPPSNLAEMALPLMVDDHVVGVLLTQSSHPEILGEQAQPILAAIASLLAVAVNNAGLLNEFQRSQRLLTKRVMELNCLTDIGHKIDDGPPLGDFLDWVCSRIPAAMQHPELCIAAITMGDQVYGYKEVLSAPSKIVGGIRVQGELLGYLHIAYKEEHGFLDDESALLGGVVNRVSNYIQTRRAEERLQQSQARYELSIAGSNDGIWDWNIPSNEVFFSPRWKDMLGYSDKEMPNEFSEFEARIHPEDHDRVMTAIADYLEGRLPVFNIECRMRHKDSSYRWILARGLVVRNQDGKPMRMAGSHTDITERKQTETLLARRAQESETLYKGSARLVQARQPMDVLRALVESTAIQSYDRANLYFFDRDWDLIPPSALKIVATWDKDEDQVPAIPLGTVYPIASLPLTKILDQPETAIIHDANTDPRLDNASRAQMIQWRIRGLVGFPLVYTGQWFGLVTVESGKPIAMDEDQTRQIESLVQQASTVLQSQRLQNSLQQQIQELDAFQRIQNQQAWESYLNTSSQIGIGYTFDRVDLQKITSSAALTEKSSILRPLEVLGVSIGNVGIQSDGPGSLNADEMDFIDTVSVELSQALERARLVEQTRSALQEARQAEQELQKFRLGIEQSADAVFIMDVQGQIIYTNSAFTRIFGYAPEEALGKSPALLAPDNIEPGMGFQAALEQTATAVGEILCKTKDGRLVPVESANTPIISQDGAILGFIAVQRDISERKQALEELRRRSEELAVLNEMGRALSSLLEENAIYEAVYEYTSRLMDTTNFFVILYHEAESLFSFPFVVLDGQKTELPTSPVRKGLSEHIIRTRQPLLLSENVVEGLQALGAEMVTIGDDEPALSWLGVPMLYRGRAVGVISVQSTTTPGIYKEIERDLLSTIAGQAAIAITNARTLEQTQQQAEYEAMINAISQRIQSTASVEDALQVALRELGRALGSKRAAVQLGVEKQTLVQK